MTEAEKVIKLVTATVRAKAEAEDGWKVELDIPEFKSKYPVPLTRVAPDIAAQLVPGQVVRLELVRQRLKQDKTGKYLTDFWWGLGRIVPIGEPVPVLAHEGPALPESRDHERDSIEAQTAFKGAIHLIANQVSPVDQLMRLTLAGMAAIQAAKRHMGAAPSNGQAEARVGTSLSGSPAGHIEPAPKTPFPENKPAGAGPGAAPTPASKDKPDMTLDAFRKAWQENKLPTDAQEVAEVIQKATDGKCTTMGQARSIGWRLDNLLAACIWEKTLVTKEKS